MFGQVCNDADIPETTLTTANSTPALQKRRTSVTFGNDDDQVKACPESMFTYLKKNSFGPLPHLSLQNEY
jgi:hypothetical protein